MTTITGSLVMLDLCTPNAKVLYNGSPIDYVKICVTDRHVILYVVDKSVLDVAAMKANKIMVKEV